MGCPEDECEGYELVNDLDFKSPESYASGVVNSEWAEGFGWLPIGLEEREFSAKFNGNGYAITNLHISRIGDTPTDPIGRNATDSTGLFGRTTDESEISNVRLLDVQVSGVVVVGGLVGSNKGNIHGVFVSGSVSGSSEIGGLAGINLGEIVDSSAKVLVSGKDETGGLVGINDGRVEGSLATGDISGMVRAGGLVGVNSESGVIVGSFATGNVTGESNLGGLAGRNDGEIVRSYSAGIISGNPVQVVRFTGGLVGLNHERGSITRSYSIAQVIGDYRLGGLVGTSHGSISFSFSSGNVTGSKTVGGLTGWNTGIILASYASSDVSGESGVGGLSGTNDEEGLIATSYAVGVVTDSGRDGLTIGGLLGSNSSSGRIIDSFWDIQSTRQRQGLGRGESLGALGATTSQMQTPTQYTGIFSEWNVDVNNADGDFDPTTGQDDLWDFGTSGQYPALKVDFNGDGVASWEEFGDQRRR